MELRKITPRDLTGKGVVGMEDTPGLSARQMQEKVEEVVRSVVIPVMNSNVDATVSKKDLADISLKSGSGDMLSIIYDADGDGVVQKADNGFFRYSIMYYDEKGPWMLHSYFNTVNKLFEYGCFVAPFTETLSVININGTEYAVVCGDDEEINLTEGRMYSFIVDTERGTVNFNSGGAGKGYTVKYGDEKPASPPQNTIWVNARRGKTAITAAVPERPEDGDIWIKTEMNGNIVMYAGKECAFYPALAMVYSSGEWTAVSMEIYKEGEWRQPDRYILSQGRINGKYSQGWNCATGNYSELEAQAVQQQESVLLQVSGAERNGVAFTLDGGIDVTEISSIRIKAKIVNITTMRTGLREDIAGNNLDYGNYAKESNFAVHKSWTSAKSDSVDYTLDTSALTGKYYLAFEWYQNGGQASIEVEEVQVM